MKAALRKHPGTKKKKQKENITRKEVKVERNWKHAQQWGGWQLLKESCIALAVFVTIEECNIVTPSDKSCLREYRRLEYRRERDAGGPGLNCNENPLISCSLRSSSSLRHAYIGADKQVITFVPANVPSVPFFRRSSPFSFRLYRTYFWICR